MSAAHIAAHNAKVEEMAEAVQDMMSDATGDEDEALAQGDHDDARRHRQRYARLDTILGLLGQCYLS